MNEKSPIEPNDLSLSKEEFHQYTDPRKYINDFEQSVHFGEQVNERIATAKANNPDVTYTSEDFEQTTENMRNEDIYKSMLLKYHDHNILKFDMDVIPADISKALDKYWKIIQDIRTNPHATGSQLEEFELSRTLAHNAAANLMVEKKLAPTFRVARLLIAFMTASQGLGAVNPNRDEQRFNITLPQRRDY